MQNARVLNFVLKEVHKDMKGIGFEVNPYDISVDNQMKSGEQRKFKWHVGDFKSIHVDPKVNDEIVECREETYGSGDLGHVKVVRVKNYEYLSIIVDFTQECALDIYMKYYIKEMLEEFPYKTKATQTTPWTDNTRHFFSILKSQGCKHGIFKEIIASYELLKRNINHILKLQANDTSNLTWYIKK